MQERRLGRSGLRLSAVGLGTMMWGRDTDEEQAREQLTLYLDAGGSYLDTAASFGGGASEEMIGSLIGDFVDRDELTLCTKAGLRLGPSGPVPDASRRQLIADLDRSLSRLGTHYVDLFCVHAWDPDVPLHEVLSTLDFIVRSGRARYVGVVGWRGWQLARAGTMAEYGGLGATALVAAQTEFSLLNRQGARDLAEAADAIGAGVIGWSALGRGVLTGKYRHTTPADSRAASEHFKSYLRPYLNSRSAQIVEAVHTAAKGLDVAPAEVALAWARDAPGVASAVIGARTAQQLQIVLGSDEVTLAPAIREALDDVSS